MLATRCLSRAKKMVSHCVHRSCEGASDTVAIFAKISHRLQLFFLFRKVFLVNSNVNHFVNLIDFFFSF